MINFLRRFHAAILDLDVNAIIHLPTLGGNRRRGAHKYPVRGKIG